MGVIFHRDRRETPVTWRPEEPHSYIAASLVHILAAIGIACLLTLVVRFNVATFAIDLHGSLHVHLRHNVAADASGIGDFYPLTSARCARPATRLANQRPWSHA